MLSQATFPRGQRESTGFLLAGILGSVLLAGGLAYSPFITAGVGFGVALLLCTVLRPLIVVGIMLALGPLDLSWITGGFKSLFPELGGLDMNGIRLIGMIAGLSFLSITDRRVT